MPEAWWEREVWILNHYLHFFDVHTFCLCIFQLLYCGGGRKSSLHCDSRTLWLPIPFWAAFICFLGILLFCIQEQSVKTQMPVFTMATYHQAALFQSCSPPSSVATTLLELPLINTRRWTGSLVSEIVACVHTKVTVLNCQFCLAWQQSTKSYRKEALLLHDSPPDIWKRLSYFSLVCCAPV